MTLLGYLKIWSSSRPKCLSRYSSAASRVNSFNIWVSLIIICVNIMRCGLWMISILILINQGLWWETSIFCIKWRRQNITDGLGSYTFDIVKSFRNHILHIRPRFVLWFIIVASSRVRMFSIILIRCYVRLILLAIWIILLEWPWVMRVWRNWIIVEIPIRWFWSVFIFIAEFELISENFKSLII